MQLLLHRRPDHGALYFEVKGVADLVLDFLRALDRCSSLQQLGDNVHSGLSLRLLLLLLPQVFAEKEGVRFVLLDEAAHQCRMYLVLGRYVLVLLEVVLDCMDDVGLLLDVQVAEAPPLGSQRSNIVVPGQLLELFLRHLQPVLGLRGVL